MSNTVEAVNKAVNSGVNNFKGKSTPFKIVSVIIFLLVLFIVGYMIYLLIVDFMNTNTNEPWILKDARTARSSQTIPGHMIPKPHDGQYGMEFTYAMWLYVNDWTTNDGEYKHVMHKGNNSAMPLQAPGIWLYPKDNKLAINMNTFYSVKESCDIGNIPIGKWFHIIVSVIGKNIDVYINGKLKKRCQFKGVPKLNYGDLYVTQWNGFDGFISRLKYFNYAIPYFKVEQLFKQGPAGGECVAGSGPVPPYLSSDYHFDVGFPNAVGFPRP